MPDQAALGKMYDESYLETGGDGSEGFAQEKVDRFRKFLTGLTPGRFIDFGCGGGDALKVAKELGWEVLGIDFNPEFSSDLKDLGIEVQGIDDPVEKKADVLFLGDVLEHLTDLDAQFPAILDHVVDGGILAAQGPLEANPSLFYLLLKLGKSFRRNHLTEMPPYHVTLATTQGQRALFTRFGLEEVSLEITEVAFPAPETLKFVRGVRPAVLYGARKLSQLVSMSDMDTMGNRYFYVGRQSTSKKSER